MNRIKMIVGLSNPKIEYHHTRHNVGSWCIYELGNMFLQTFQEDKKFLGFTSTVFIHNHYIRLLVPNIFMNINGQSISSMASFYNIYLNQILIVHDDLDVSLGCVKLKYGYGHNGHNGLKSVINLFNKKINFYRFRIGIGRPERKDQISSFVLSKPSKQEKILIIQSIKDAAKKILKLITI